LLASPVGPTDPRVLIVSASVGGGHDGAAYELRRRLRQRGYRVDVRDYLDAMPARVGYLLRWVYAHQLRLAPASYQLLYQWVARTRLGFALGCWFACWACPRLRRWTRGCDTVVVTYPLAGQAFGRLRRRGLQARLVVFLTDFSPHPLWVVPAADLHLVLHEVTADDIRARRPAARVRVAGPAVRDVFGRRPDARQLGRTRQCFGIPEGPVALLVAGSWGAGELDRVAREVVNAGGYVPVVVCGQNQALRARLARDGRVVALGWVDDMPGLMATADILIQNAGGLSSLEAFATGLPVLSYRCIPGHGRDNAEAMARAGVAMHACTRPGLAAALSELDEVTRRRLRSRAAGLFRDDPAAAVDELASATSAPQPATGQIRPAAGLAVAAALSVLLALLAVTFPDAREERQISTIVHSVEHRVTNLSHTAGWRTTHRHRAVGVPITVLAAQRLRGGAYPGTAS